MLFCAFWSILAKMLPALTNQNGTCIYEQHFKKLDMKSINFSTGLKVEDVPKLESESNLNLNVFELRVNVEDELSMTSEPLAVSLSDTESETMELLWYENFYCLFEKLHVLLGNHIKAHVFIWWWA